MEINELNLPVPNDTALPGNTVPKDKQADSSWKLQSVAVPSTPSIPADHFQLVIPARDQVPYFFVFPQWLYKKLVALARSEKVTLYVILLASFQALLYRYSDQDETVVGTCYAEGRVEDLARASAFHIDMSDNPGFEELLERVHEKVLGSNEHWNISSGPPVEALQQEQDIDRSAPFQNIFAFGTALLHKLQPEALDQLLPEGNDWRGKCELALLVQETEQGLEGWIEYQSKFYEGEAVARLVDHWQVMLEGMVAAPALRISELPLLTEKERRQILVDWNDTKVDFSSNRCIHQLFETQVERDADASAIIFQDPSLTYGELNRRANQLAHYLQRHGVGPEVLVGLCVERSPEMIVGVLGILKAGGAYVPLDPTYPSERIAFMLADARVSMLLTQERFARDIVEHPMEVIYLDTHWDKIGLEREENPVSGVTAENVAYIIYTSGSSGTPKGVVIQHRSLVNYVEFAGTTYDVKPSDRVLQFAPLSFDASAEEIYPCLTKGATLVLRTSSMIDSISLFLQKCQEWGITVLDLPTAYWHELTRKISSGSIALPSTIRLVIIGGEKASPEQVASWQQYAGSHVQLVNTYGPTEATIVATMYKVPGSRKATLPLRELPIGRGVANTQVYLLDRFLNPVPIGVPGELHIGGVGLAREYLNRTALTAQKFISHPFSTEPEVRLYKTGDQARYLPSGDIEFLGRLDQQVKIRGYRIELGEIEAILEKHPGIQEAVVVAREDASGDKRLVAYVVPHRDQLLTSSTLRLFAQERLPDYMVPSSFVLMEALPLTPSGKVDRRGLPAPEQTSLEQPETFVAPTLAVHRQLVQIWEELLNVRPIGIRDNFFELGGHSLLAVRLIDRIEQIWGKRISAATLLARATIEELTNVLVQPEDATTQSPAETVQARSHKRPSPSNAETKFSVKSVWTRFMGKRRE